MPELCRYCRKWRNWLHGHFARECTTIKDLENEVKISKDVPESISDLAFDPQTSGGLLISVDTDKALVLLELLRQKGVEDAAIIGEVRELSEHKIILEES